MPRRPAFSPCLEGVESRLAPSTAQLSTATILPYIEQENIYKQVNTLSLSSGCASIYMKYGDLAIYMQYDGLKGS